MPSSNRRPLYSEQDLAAAATGPDAAAPSSSTVPASTAERPAGSPSATPSDVPQQRQPGGAAAGAGVGPMDQPCSVNAAVGAVYAGALGYVFGALPSAVRHGGRAWGLVHTDGVRSAQQLALMSGLYSLVHCLMQRLRMHEDGWNRGTAGCATGLVLGWGGGPWSALQSCAGIGALSYILDFGTQVPAAAAAGLAAVAAPHNPHRWQRGGGAAPAPGSSMDSTGALALPPLMWLGQCCAGSGGGYFDAAAQLPLRADCQPAPAAPDACSLRITPGGRLAR